MVYKQISAQVLEQSRNLQITINIAAKITFYP